MTYIERKEPMIIGLDLSYNLASKKLHSVTVVVNIISKSERDRIVQRCSLPTW